MYFTEIESDELKKKINEEKNINNLKILLANEATSILHGPKAAKESAETALETFVKGGLGRSIPEKTIKKNIVIDGINIVELVFQNNLVQSKSEVRRIIKNNGIRINDEIISDEKKIINIDSFVDNSYIKLSVGKKTHLKIIID